MYRCERARLPPSHHASVVVGGGGEGVGGCGALKSREDKNRRARCSHADARAPHDRDRDRRKVKWREMTQEQRFKVLENSLKSWEKVLGSLKKPSFLDRPRPILRLFSEIPSETEFRKPEIPRLRLKTGDFGLISVSSPFSIHETASDGSCTGLAKRSEIIARKSN